MEKLEYFFYIEIASSKMRLVINQRKYTMDLVKETKTANTPINANSKISIKYGQRCKKMSISSRKTNLPLLLDQILPMLTQSVNLCILHLPICRSLEMMVVI